MFYTQLIANVLANKNITDNLNLVPTWDLDFFISLTRDHMVNPDRESSQSSIADIHPEVNRSLFDGAAFPQNGGVLIHLESVDLVNANNKFNCLTACPRPLKVRG